MLSRFISGESHVGFVCAYYVYDVEHVKGYPIMHEQNIYAYKSYTVKRFLYDYEMEQSRKFWKTVDISKIFRGGKRKYLT